MNKWQSGLQVSMSKQIALSDHCLSDENKVGSGTPSAGGFNQTSNPDSVLHKKRWYDNAILYSP